MRLLARSSLLALAAVGAAAVPAGFEEARQSITADEIRGHLYFLSLDALRGRAPGTPGGGLAAEYVASRFLGMGLERVGGSYFQPVPLVGITLDPATSSLAFESRTRRVAADYPGDAVIWPGAPDQGGDISGELVFVGYGADAPEWGWDDYKGRDLNGKVAVFLVGDPPAPPDEPGLFGGRAMTYYGRWTYKLEQARRRGAAGALIVHSGEAAGYDWEVVRTSWAGEQLSLEGTGTEAALPLQGWLTRDFARRVFAAGGLDLAELYVQATRRDFRPVATGLTVRARMNSRSRAVRTRNVIGYLPGAHPERRSQVVVLTSHYDHLGTGPAVDGDSIYNGAYDNASGVALLLEVADAFSRLEPRPDRGILFIATGAEEAGLLGSEHYVRAPPVPLRRTVAALNIDGANLWGETDDVVALGADLSTLGDIVGARAEELGLSVMPDPAPEQGSFFRSDHFPFARNGVPVLHLKHGIRFRGRPPGWGERLLSEYQQRHYHRPSDEYDPAFDLAGAVQQGRLLFAVAYDIAMWDRTAEWYEGEGVGFGITAPSAGR
ncbi:MAG TPA: M20/M25/M40 family metallo-hydrolase [Longimicrobiales bacterium]|nr:M20/M25/M40 family metallo-hydrolase [Longimicrobiales bacterium]